MLKLITVVVAVYNVEKYLNKCVNSILAQTHKNIEVVLVDDGSTDTSGEMCDKFAENDSRVKVIHKENGGLSDARNAGLAVAQGDYLVFCDGDDWMERNILETALETAEVNDAEVVIWGYYADFVDDCEKLLRRDVHKCSNKVCTREKNSEFLLNKECLGLIGYAWNKLYKSTLLFENQFGFQKGLSLVEDMVFNKPVLLKSNKVLFLDMLGTHYMQRPRTTLGTKYYPNYFDLKLMACRAREELLKGYKIDFSKVEAVVSTLYFGAIFSSTRMIKHSDNVKREDKRKLLKKIYRQIEEQDLWNKCKTLTMKERCFLFLIRNKCFGIILSIPLF